jgi:hypothetical protein
MDDWMIWLLIISVGGYLAYEVDRLRQRVAKLEVERLG